ncbi:hypothetical protein AGDE_15607 [Angomonas deanei]|uniref:Uncharacterized protein n=1 Tax=Angomonas deanei TaxID=59799 RepID=A0A7G2CQK3_9TRYP|nr:hypothetical protein AGDE_15607 [Angomonas deanei]CAD2221264.1 hypothetical protein, conserved [Angomonas deanei]|eukprot:EPY18776.1 hypothetical protein AGDE_15607 [Angomonas deanei]
MSPLRQYCQSSLPHLKVDQRFGKVGQPQTAIANFIVAPIITTYRPRHFHDLSPGDLLEFHYELSLVLTKGIEGVDKIMIGYGPMWKRYAVPYFYLHCKDYAQQVKRLCPEEIPNSRAEAIYESDIVKNITDIVLVVEQLEVLNNISFLEALRRRVDLSALYDTFQLFFEPIENYTIEITNLNSVPSQFYIKASMTELAQKPQPIVLHGDPNIWEELPTVSRVVVVDEANHHNNHNSHNEKETPYYTENPSTGGRRKGGKKKRNNNHNNNMLMVVVPVLLSAVCIATTAAIVLAKEKRK